MNEEKKKIKIWKIWKLKDPRKKRKHKNSSDWILVQHEEYKKEWKKKLKELIEYVIRKKKNPEGRSDVKKEKKWIKLRKIEKDKEK